MLSENVHWLKGFRVGPTSIKCCKVYELSASFQLWPKDEFQCRKRIPNRMQCVLESASVAAVKRSEKRLYNTMNDDTNMICNYNLLHEQIGWSPDLFTNSGNPFSGRFSERERDLLFIDALLPVSRVSTMALWHTNVTASYIKTNNSRLRNTVLQYEQTADRNGRTIITRLRKPSFKCLGTCTADSWIILIDINIPLFHVWWVAKFVFFSSFLDLIFYKTAIWISWQVLSTFPTSAPLVKRFAPRRKIRVFVPSYLASWTCKNYKYRCISHFACTMYLIRKPDRQSCSEKIIKLCDYNLISEVGSPTRINNFLNPAKCLRKKSSQWCWFNTKKENIFF